MTKETGGQAFPRQQWEYDGQDNVLQYQEEGMTLRDYFAAKAMQALATSGLNTGAWDDYDDLAKSAWSIADAMLRAREAS